LVSKLNVAHDQALKEYASHLCGNPTTTMHTSLAAAIAAVAAPVA